jgi:hypothetical protein
MNVEIGTEDEQFPKKEYINGIFVAVRYTDGHKVFVNENLVKVFHQVLILYYMFGSFN